MSARTTILVGLTALVVSACHQAPLHAAYPVASPPIRRAVREALGRGACSHEGPRVVEHGPWTREVRGCGAPVTFVCADDEHGPCEPETTGARSATPPTLDAETIAGAAEIERIAHEAEDDQADPHAAVLVSGAVLLGLSAVGMLIGTLGYELHECGLGACPSYVGSTLEIAGGAAIAGAAIGLAMLVGGSISWRLAQDRRRDRAQELVEPCSSISFEATPQLARVVAEVCFP